MKPINKMLLENAPHPTLSHEERAKAEICGVKPSPEGEGLDEGS